MKKGYKVGHTPGCRNPRCRGKCMKQAAEIEKKRRERDNTILFTGPSKSGKTAYMLDKVLKASNDFEKSVKFDLPIPKENLLWDEYAKKKAEYIAKVTASRRDEWESLGRLLGKAYTESDESFFALLEGFHRGKTNEDQGRPALGRKNAP